MSEFPEYAPPVGHNLVGRRVALHLLGATDAMLGKISEDVLSAREVATLQLAAAQVHALLDVADAIRGTTFDPVEIRTAAGETLADLAARLNPNQDQT